MKTIGLIGGMSWESTAPYYRHINEAIRKRLGGLHSAKLILHSVDFHEIEELQRLGAWDEAGRILANVAVSLEAAGADFLVLCTNTMHKVAHSIESAVRIPLMHIADPTGREIVAAGHSVVGLIATRFTMEQDFYRDRLSQRYGLEVLVPEREDREIIHRVIYEELCVGVVRPESRVKYLQIIDGLVARGAQAVILGCTEITLLIEPKDTAVALFDTTLIHAHSAADEAAGFQSQTDLARSRGEQVDRRAPPVATIEIVDPAGEEALNCLREYYKELNTVFEEGFDPDSGVSALPDEMVSPRGCFFVARLSGAVVGCAGIKFNAQGDGEIKRMWVRKSARGLGVGRSLLAAIEGHAQSIGVRRLQLDTHRNLVEARALYRRSGYVETAAYNSNPFAHHWFEKRLSPR